MSELHALFSERPQAHGFTTERQAIRSAREELGGKAKKGLMFVISSDNGKRGWLNVSDHELQVALLSRK